MNKSQKKSARISNALSAIVATAAAVGFTAANAFAGGVELARKLKGNAGALNKAGAEYKAGYVARYLKDESAMSRRWGNMSEPQIIDEARGILAKPSADSTKPGRRTELEHKACRAADVSWSSCKRRAGIVPTKAGNRKPRPAAKATAAKAVPVDLVKASPTLKDKPAANDYFATAAAALLATVNKNAKRIDPRLSSAVADFHSALKALGLIAA